MLGDIKPGHWLFVGVVWLVVGIIGVVQMLQDPDRFAVKGAIFYLAALAIFGAIILWRTLRSRQWWT
jgi:hypothetical protein